jgi:flagellar biosynthesis chaperone FliJ
MSDFDWGKPDWTKSECPGCNRLAQAEREKAQAYTYAGNLAIWLWRNVCNEDPPDWIVLQDLMGVLTQIDNMLTAISEFKHQHDKAQAALADEKTLHASYVEMHNAAKQDWWEERMRLRAQVDYYRGAYETAREGGLKAQRERDEAKGALSRIVEGVEEVADRLDQLADQWGDEGVFRRCRDRLRALVREEG